MLILSIIKPLTVIFKVTLVMIINYKSKQYPNFNNEKTKLITLSIIILIILILTDFKQIPSQYIILPDIYKYIHEWVGKVIS